MQFSELTLEASDGIKLNISHWKSDESAKPPKAVICLVHGLGDHCGLYLHVAKFLTDSGYSVLAMDLRGHGKSCGKRGHIPSFTQVLDDLKLLLEKSKTIYPNIPRFLYGHSFGGNLVLNYILRYKPEITGAISTSPWLRLAFEPPALKMFLAKITNKLIPTLSQSNSLNPFDLSHDKNTANTYTSDSLVHNQITAGFFSNTSASGIWILEHADELNVPLLLMHGSGDRITSHAASQQFAQKTNKKCTFKLWDGLYHELHNEFQKQEILTYIVQWLDNQLPF